MKTGWQPQNSAKIPNFPFIDININIFLYVLNCLYLTQYIIYNTYIA